MSYKSFFERYEMKYIISREQKEIILKAMEPYMKLDMYGKTTIRNIYFDTENYRIIRHSIERPIYKEKLRVRSYKKVNKKDEVYVELRKKYENIVYKRRIALSYKDAEDWLCNHKDLELKTQIESEINYFISFYKGLKPEIFITFDREAYYMLDDSDLRVTFDENIKWRKEDISLESDIGGNDILEEGNILMELKSAGGIPLWLTHVLTKECIYKQPFSKYGKAYEEIINEYM